MGKGSTVCNFMQKKYFGGQGGEVTAVDARFLVAGWMLVETRNAS